MAIIYSYPHAVPTINDMVLGARFRENEGISTNSFYISDIVTLVQGQLGTVPTLQEVTGQGANTTDQIQINGIDVATINDIPGTPTLQEAVNSGNTVTSGTTELSLTANSLSILNTATSVGNRLLRDSLRFLRDDGSGTINRIDLMAPLNIADNRSISLPDADGIVALTSYKVYTAKLTQSGTNAPIATILENTFDGTVTFEYTGPGLYNAVLVGEFTVGQTIAMLWGGTSSQVFKAAPFSQDRILLVTYNTSGVAANDQMGITTLEIKVYN